MREPSRSTRDSSGRKKPVVTAALSISVTISAVALVLGFQNCAPGFEALSSLSKNSLGSSGDGDIPIDPNAPISVYVRNLVVPQGQDLAFKVELNKAHSAAVVVQLQPKGDTALAGVDFVDAQVTATIPAGQLSTVVKVMNRVPTIDLVDKKMSLRAVTVSAGQIVQSEGVALIKATRRLVNFKQIAPSNSFTCGLLTDNSVTCWGGPFGGVNGVLNLLTDAQSIVAGSSFACAITSAKTVKCWGSFYDLAGAAVNSDLPLLVAGLDDVRELFVAPDPYLTGRFCAVSNGNIMNCLGKQTSYSTTPAAKPPVGIPGVQRVADQNYNSACAVLTDGTLSCWNDQSVFYPLPGVSGVKDYLANNGATCSLYPDNSMLCMFSSPFGIVAPVRIANVKTIFESENGVCALNFDGSVKCFNYSGSDTSLDALFATVKDIVQVAALNSGTCVVTKGGSVRCTGVGIDAKVQFSGAAEVAPTIPVDVLTPSNVSQISSAFAGTCAFSSAKGVQCFDGGNFFSGKPVYDYPSLTSVKKLAVGFYAQFALSDSGVVSAWGYNAGNMLLNSSTQVISDPTPVPSLAGSKDIAATNYSACAITSSDTVVCWGSDYDATQTPVAISGTEGAKRLSIGQSTACAVMANSSVKCWTRYGTPVATAVSGLADVRDVSIGESFQCALLNSGKVFCWGGNYFAQTGTGQASYSVSLPTEVAGLKNAKQISSGPNHTCVVTADDRVQCWGYNEMGQMGSSNGLIVKTPYELPGLSGIRQVVAGYQHTSFIMADGSVRTLGVRLPFTARFVEITRPAL